MPVVVVGECGSHQMTPMEGSQKFPRRLGQWFTRQVDLSFTLGNPLGQGSSASSAVADGRGGGILAMDTDAISMGGDQGLRSLTLLFRWVDLARR